MRYIGEKPDIKKIGLRASNILYRYGFDYVVPEINFKAEYFPEERSLQFAFRPMRDVMCDDPDPWIEISANVVTK
jgi:hypothetical protein